MIEHIFLARTEEQQQFRRFLSTLLPSGLRKHFPTVSKLFPDAKSDPHPLIMLLYGEGGMGKSSLIRRLLKLASQEKDFKGKVHTLFLDWEDEQKLTLDLQVGHDFIEPETVLSVLHRALVKAGWGSCFGEYDQTVQGLRSAESKVEDALRGQLENNLPDKLSKLGAKGLAFYIRSHPGAGAIPQPILETTLDATFQIGAEGLYQARQFVQKALSAQEYEIYQQPNERLAEALGHGLAQLAHRQPLALLLDTYEIVDRPDCDYTLRRVIRASGERVLWVIAGRSNLADSGQRGQVYFRGYKRDFAETQLYAKSLSEFGLDLIQQYFAQGAPDQPLSEAEADAVARFSLGIPFVIRQAAVMYREGKPVDEIVAPVATALGSKRTAHDQVVTTTSERFLMHCFGAPEQEKDQQAIYALALMRRPDPDLLRAMLDETDLERRLQTLRERYSFILVEQLRLDEKLNRFLQEYMLNPLRRTSQRVQNLNENAMTWLSLQLEHKTNGITDTAEKIREDAIAELILDLAHHAFWQGEDDGWRYLAPRFVEGWQYSRTWTKSLLEVAESFRQVFGKDNQKRLDQFAAVLTDLPDMERVQIVLDDLHTLEKRGWLEKSKAELKTILLLKQGQLLYRQERNGEALKICSQAEGLIPSTIHQLRQDLAKIFEQIGWRFSLVNRAAVPSLEGKEALSKAIKLNPDNGKHLIALGVAQHGLKQHTQAAENLLAGIRLEGEKSYSLNWLGNMYLALKRYDEAIATYQTAITLDQSNAYPHNGLGNVYRNLKRYDEAISVFQTAITLDQSFATPHNGLGNVYRALKRYDEAIATFQTAITLDQSYATPHSNLGNVYSDLKRYDEAIAAFQTAIHSRSIRCLSPQWLGQCVQRFEAL